MNGKSRAAWAVMLLCLGARAEAEPWRPFGPTGGSVNAIVVEPRPPYTVYIAAGGVWKSEDQGATWRHLGLGPQGVVTGLGPGITELALDPADSRVLYAAGGPGFALYRTQDGGEHWQQVANARSPAVAAEPGGSVAYANCDGVCRSRDGGDTWEQVLEGHNSELEGRILIDPAVPTTVYANIEGQLWKSTDGGTSWTRLEIPGAGFAAILSLALAPSAPGTLYANADGLWRSEDGGATWVGPFAPFPSGCGLPFYGACEMLAVDPADPRTLYAGSAYGLFVSRDGGATLHSVATGLANPELWGGGYTAALAVAFGAQSGRIFLGSGKGIHLSDDDGAHWRRLEVQGHYRNLVTGFRLDPHDRQSFLLRNQDEWLVSHDGGASFARLTDPRLDDPLATITYDPWIPGRLWAVGGDLLVSRNGGQSWTVAGALPREVDGRSVTVVAPRVLLLGGSGIWRSQDSGATWRRVLAGTVDDIGGSTVRIRRIDPDPTSVATFYATADLCLRSRVCRPQVYRSTDAGRHWRRWYGDPRPRNGWIFALPDPRRPGSVRLLGSQLGPLVETRDDGQTFETLSVAICGFCSVLDVAMDRQHPETLYAAGNYSESPVSRSRDGGLTWGPWSEGLIPAFYLADLSEGSRVLQDPFRPRRLYFVPLTGGVYRTTVP